LFYSRVKNEMISQLILGHIDSDSLAVLSLKKEHYEWTSSDGTKLDGLMMLKFILDELRPSTNVGVSREKSIIETATLAHYGEDVKKMLDAMETAYTDINKQEPYTWDCRHLYDALLSGRNQNFKDFIQHEKNQWNVGRGSTPAQLIELARLQFANSAEDWKFSTKTDASDVKLAAMVTKFVDAAITKSNPPASGGGSGGGNRPAAGTGKTNSVDAWRKKKSFGDSVERNGKTYCWCPHHVMEGQYDGLYVFYPPEKHAEWLEEKKRRQSELTARKKKKAPATENPDTSKDTKTSEKLALTDSLRAALVTNSGMTPEAIDALYEEHSRN
jgi:hypothetical protein